MKVLVCGSRGWGIDLTDAKQSVRRRLDQLLAGGEPQLILGGANGPDEFAREWAAHTDVDHLVLYPRWTQQGKQAGILRNLRMLDEQPDLVIAFWDGTSRGTKHTIDEARRRGIPVEVITEGEAA